ncbi:MAG: hypothetical protein GX621_18045 [Pirellulaceae bacterium]|nr:hypothetical protein [Pirellulaceae bacterium]
MFMQRRSPLFLAFASALLLCGVVLADEPSRKAKKPDGPPARAIRLAVFDLDVTEGLEVSPKALTDQVVAMLSTLPKVTLVSRDQLAKVANEHEIALSGLVDGDTAVRLGKFVSAQYVVVGRASRIGQTDYLVLRIVDVETTVQTTVAAKAPAAGGPEAILDRLTEPLVKSIRVLQSPRQEKDDEELAALRKLAKPLAGKVVVVAVDEEHINRPLDDPAAQMAVVHRLESLGIEAIVPVEPIAGWKEHLLASGKYDDRKVDFLLEGQGTSGFAARLQGLTSCRARVELRLIGLPGRSVTATERGVAADVDLVEALAAKKALEKAGEQACDALIRRTARVMREKTETQKQ